MIIIARAEWGARPAKSAPAKVAIASRTATCTHHDGEFPVIVRSFAEACARVRADQNYHMDHNGWSDIGYNYLVTSAPGTSVDGLVFEGRGRDAIGAHCLNHNTEWVGIQVAIGGGQTPSPAALASVRALHRNLEDAAAHSLAFKVHSDGFNTACPGPILRTWVHGGMQVATVSQAASPLPSFLTATTDTEDELMALTLTNPATKADATAASGLSSIWAYTFLNYKMLVELGKAAGIDVDESAIAAQVLAGLIGPLKAAVAAAVTAGGSVDQITDTVVARLTTAIQGA